MACLEQKPNQCPRAAKCKTLRMWEGLERVIEEYFENITLAALLEEHTGADDYVI